MHRDKLHFWLSKQDTTAEHPCGFLSEFVEIFPVSESGMDLQKAERHGCNVTDNAFVVVHTRASAAAAPVTSLESAAAASAAAAERELVKLVTASAPTEKVRTLLVASSTEKRDKWVRMLREHCVALN